MKYVFLLGLLCTFSEAHCSHSQESDEENPRQHQSTRNGDFSYIFTSPRTLITGGSNELHFRPFGNDEKGVLKVQVFYKKDYNSPNETVAVVKKFKIPPGDDDITLRLPIGKIDENVYNGRIQINGSFGDSKFSGSDTVSFATPKNSIVIIQTDKPMYQPGQTVRFRVLKVDKYLRPSSKNKKADVYIEDSKGTILAQYKDINLEEGMVQNEFPLSDEPGLGIWTIRVTTKDTTETTTFTVKEYVLPKFEVKVNFPPFVLATDEIIPVEICAKYTYGKPVVGTLNLNASLEKYTYYYDLNQEEKYPTLQESFDIDGCYKYKLKVTKIELNNIYTYRRIMIVANVIEEGTGVSRNVTEYLQRQTSPLNLEFIDSLDFYKPGLPYNGKLKVTHPDNTPAADEPIRICVTISKKRILAKSWATKTLQICRNYTSNEDGLIFYIIPPQNVDVISINIDAKSSRFVKDPSQSEGRQNVMSQPQTSKYLSAYYSPSGNFIQLQPVTQPIACDSKLSLKLLFTSKKNAHFKFYYQVVRQSKVVGEFESETTFSVKDDVSEKYRDEDKVINGKVKQIDPPKELLTGPKDDCPAAEESGYTPPIGEIDINIDITTNLSPGIRVIVYYVTEGDEVVADSSTLTIERCFSNKVEFSFEDKEQQPGLDTAIKINAAPNSLCGIKVIDKSVTLLDSSDQLTFEKVFQLVENQDTNQYYPSNPCYNNEIQPGLDNRALKSIIRPFPGGSSYQDSLSAFQTVGYLIISNLFVVTRPCTNNNNIAYGRGGMRSKVALSAEMDSVSSSRPAPGGVSSTVSVSAVRDRFPETWLFKMEMTGSDGSFQATETLPDTITEWIGSAACISPEEGLGISNTSSLTAFQAFFIDYTLPVSVIRGEIFLVVVSIFNYVDAALPITVTLDNPDGFEVAGQSIDGDVCAESNGSVNLRLYLKATKVGKNNITVHAESSQSPAVCRDSKVSKLYARDAIRKPIEVEPEGFPAENVINTLFCPSDEENNVFETTISLTLPNDVIPDSDRAIIDVTGNVMGPALNNLNGLVSLPTGCGEQNMVKFTPNYLVLDYLKDIGMLTEDIKRKAIANLMTGYQRELTFRHDDGSFSAFGMTDKSGSMFLTAFVLRSFYAAERYITIDKRVIQQAQDWIISKQTADGCFPNLGQVISIGLQGGIKNEKASGSITAYVLSSLLLSKFDNSSVTDAAFGCLDKNPPSNPYSQLLYAYAEVLGGKTEDARNHIDEARQRINRTDGMEYFLIVNGSEAIKIETTSYAVLTTLALGGTASEALPYVRYLTTHLNPYGGFSSTQDTCVGLEALSKFAKLVYKDPLDLVVKLSGGVTQTVNIIDDNKILVQRHKVTDVPSDVGVEATGTGCGLIQTVIRYNTKSPPETKTFSLEVRGECSNKECTEAKINVLTSYVPDGLKSGMATMEIKMITGFVPDKNSLNDLKNTNNILRIDVQNNMVIIYFSEISNTVLDFTIKVIRVVEVTNVQHGTAKVYDYYAKENSASTSYNIKGLGDENNTI